MLIGGKERKTNLIHWGNNMYDPKLVGKIRNDNWNKPRGGLWTSPVVSEWGWKDWCDDEHFRNYKENEHFILEFVKKDKIFVIDSIKDLLSLPHVPGPAFMGSAYLNFEAISQSYDCIWLTEKGEYKTRFSKPVNLYGWDVESVLILNPHCVKQVS